MGDFSFASRMRSMYELPDSGETDLPDDGALRSIISPDSGTFTSADIAHYGTAVPRDIPGMITWLLVAKVSPVIQLDGEDSDLVHLIEDPDAHSASSMYVHVSAGLAEALENADADALSESRDDVIRIIRRLRAVHSETVRTMSNNPSEFLLCCMCAILRLFAVCFKDTFAGGLESPAVKASGMLANIQSDDEAEQGLGPRDSITVFGMTLAWFNGYLRSYALSPWHRDAVGELLVIAGEWLAVAGPSDMFDSQRMAKRVAGTSMADNLLEVSADFEKIIESSAYVLFRTFENICRSTGYVDVDLCSGKWDGFGRARGPEGPSDTSSGKEEEDGEESPRVPRRHTALPVSGFFARAVVNSARKHTDQVTTKKVLVSALRESILRYNMGGSRCEAATRRSPAFAQTVTELAVLNSECPSIAETIRDAKNTNEVPDAIAKAAIPIDRGCILDRGVARRAAISDYLMLTVLNFVSGNVFAMKHGAFMRRFVRYVSGERVAQSRARAPRGSLIGGNIDTGDMYNYGTPRNKKMMDSLEMFDLDAAMELLAIKDPNARDPGTANPMFRGGPPTMVSRITSVPFTGAPANANSLVKETSPVGEETPLIVFSADTPFVITWPSGAGSDPSIIHCPNVVTAFCHWLVSMIQSRYCMDMYMSEMESPEGMRRLYAICKLAIKSEAPMLPRDGYGIRGVSEADTVDTLSSDTAHFDAAVSREEEELERLIREEPDDHVVGLWCGPALDSGSEGGEVASASMVTNCASMIPDGY